MEIILEFISNHAYTILIIWFIICMYYLISKIDNDTLYDKDDWEQLRNKKEEDK